MRKFLTELYDEYIDDILTVIVIISMSVTIIYFGYLVDARPQ
jgi:hypothetical protein